MASSLHKFWICALGAGVCSTLAAQSANAPQELVFDSQSLTLDRKTNLIQLQGPRITQGDLHIEADQALATGLDFQQSSEWQFMGNVRIAVGSARIEADSAVFTFDEERLARGELVGTPAAFTDTDSSGGKPISGGANKLTYDYVGRTLRLSENAWVNKDQYEIHGCDLIYDFADERVSSGSADCGGELFRVRVVPQSEDQSPAADSPQ